MKHIIYQLMRPSQLYVLSSDLDVIYKHISIVHELYNDDDVTTHGHTVSHNVTRILAYTYK